MKKVFFPEYLFISFFYSFPILLLILLRSVFETTSKLKYLGNFSNTLLMEFSQITELCFFSTIHYWLNRFTKFPKVIFNSVFISIYSHIAFYGLCDFNAGINGMQFLSPSSYNVWVKRTSAHIDHFTMPTYSVLTGKKKNMSREIVMEVMKVQMHFYIVFYLIYSLIFCVTCYLLYKYREYFIHSTFIGKFLLPKFDNSQKMQKEDNTTITSRSIEENNIKINKKNPKSKIKTDLIILLLHMLSIVYIGTTLFIITSENNLKSAYYSRVSFLQSVLLSLYHFEKNISPNIKLNLTHYIRDYLPPGRRWLDTRPNPIYPAVHSDLATFCAYNINASDCINFKPHQQIPLVSPLPNVLFIVYESLTPGTYLIDNKFIKEHASLDEYDPLRYITSTKYFSSDIMRRFNYYQDYAITFSGMSSLGIPTASGLHSLMTGMYPSQSFYNVLDGSLIHSDDFPSQMRNYGYRSFWIAASDYRFDGLNLWFFRRTAKEEAMNRLRCKESFGDLIDDEYQRNLVGHSRMKQLQDCTNSTKKINSLAQKLKQKRIDFPKWFDYALFYPLTENNAKYIHLPKESALDRTKWASDRVTAAQVINHWKQHKEFMKSHNISKPLFGGVSTMDSHFEFFGYDKPEFYTDRINKKNLKSNDDWTKKRFIRVNKYADEYVGGLLEWFKENEPNTIFVLTGDHSSRKVPVFEQDETIIDDVVYSSDCVHQSSGSDAFFVTSGMIGYFGNDTKVKEILQFDKLKGKTIKLPTDHNDLIYTVEDILTKLNGTEMQPTQRRGRNLIEISNLLMSHIENDTLKQGIEEIDESHWRSFSFNHYNIDYREGTNLYRVHPADRKGGHLYYHASYPQCVRKKERPPLKLGMREGDEMYQRMEEKIAAENYLTVNNRLYNYKFRDGDCVRKGHCDFPEIAGELEFYDFSFPLDVSVSLVKLMFGIWIAFEIVSLSALVIRVIKIKQYIRL